HRAPHGFGEHCAPSFFEAPPLAGGVAISATPNSQKGEMNSPLAGIRRSGNSRSVIFQEQGIQMGKRSARTKKQFRDGNSDGFHVHGISGGWDPIEERRDQIFIRHVKPRSEGQQALMDAIESGALTLALGPAGTGKTYLAIAAAVKALEESRID